jgi:hypothetical protein
MKATRKIRIATAVLLSLGLLCAVIYALFHGYFDHGRFEIMGSQRSPLGKLAIVARRSDHDALDNDQYFVLIADHEFTPRELRHAYYYDDQIAFRSGGTCLYLHWIDTHNLLVACANKSITPGDIAIERSEVDGTQIHYVGIPPLLHGN